MPAFLPIVPSDFTYKANSKTKVTRMSRLAWGTDFQAQGVRAGSPAGGTDHTRPASSLRAPPGPMGATLPPLAALPVFLSRLPQAGLLCHPLTQPSARSATLEAQEAPSFQNSWPLTQHPLLLASLRLAAPE